MSHVVLRSVISRWSSQRKSPDAGLLTECEDRAMNAAGVTVLATRALQSSSVGEHDLAPTSAQGTLDMLGQPDAPIAALIQRSGLLESCKRDGDGDVERQIGAVDAASVTRGSVLR